MTTSDISVKATPQTGNMNPQMGAANKEMIEKRLNNKNDKLTVELIKLVCPKMADVLSTCVVRSNDDSGLRGSEMAMLYEVMLEDGTIHSDSVNVASKGSVGLGSLNQLAIFWLDSILTTNELQSPVGEALTMMCGATKNSDKPKSPVAVGDLMVGGNATQYGMPLQMWLGVKSNLEKFIYKALNVMPGQLGKSVLLLNMRGGGQNGEDIFVMVDAGSFGEVIVKEAIQETSKKQKFLRIGATDRMIRLSRGMALKRVGGAVARGNGASQLQMIVQPRGLLDMITNAKPGSKIKSVIAVETPKAESLKINHMNGKTFIDEEDDFMSKQTEALLSRLEKTAINFDVL